MAMPASTTPIMLVQVWSETPTYGARTLPAISSRISVQALEMKTTILACQMLRQANNTTSRTFFANYALG